MKCDICSKKVTHQAGVPVTLYRLVGNLFGHTETGDGLLSLIGTSRAMPHSMSPVPEISTCPKCLQQALLMSTHLAAHGEIVCDTLVANVCLADLALQAIKKRHAGLKLTDDEVTAITHFIDHADYEFVQLSSLSAAAYREKAKALYQKDGNLEIDDNASISRGADKGAYVGAWVWVPNEDTPKEEVTSAPETSVQGQHPVQEEQAPPHQ